MIFNSSKAGVSFVKIFVLEFVGLGIIGFLLIVL